MLPGLYIQETYNQKGGGIEATVCTVNIYMALLALNALSFHRYVTHARGFPGGTVVKYLPAKAGDSKGTQVQSLGRKDGLEKEMATHCSILAWKIPSTEEPLGLHPWGCNKWNVTEHACTHRGINCSLLF